MLYYTGVSTLWSEGTAFLTQYPGLDAEASRWILDQGVINILTDAPSTDNPADLSYPNHTACAEYLVNHTEIVANIDRIPVHQGFSIMVIPLRLMRCSASPVRVFALWEEGS